MRSTSLLSAAASILVVSSLILTGCGRSGATDLADGVPSQITLDYAYYSPISLVVKHFEWLEEEFGEDGTRIRWVHSLGSNRANEYSQSGTAQFASTAGVAALLARANGVPIQSVYVYSKPEWAALVTATDSEIQSVSDLAGKRVAATRGLIRTSSCCRLSSRQGCPSVTSKSFTCNMRKAKLRSIAVMCMHGQVSTHTWRRARSRVARGCSSASQISIHMDS
jgi:hypothetical protein